MDDFAFTSRVHQMAPVEPTEDSRVLAIGDVSLWRRSGTQQIQTREILLSDLVQLTAVTLAEFNPDLVLSPIVTARFDCLDVAHRLSELGFSGRYRALARDLPDPSLIRAEILRDCPGLNFEILNICELHARAN
ncbi:MAG: hypothetical protein AAGK37_09575 [Pseudomonadota bacterium]